MKFVSNLLKQHLQRYPLMELTDIYKLLHQAATGAAHAAPLVIDRAAHTSPASAHIDAAAVLAALQSELRAMGEGEVEPLLDPISPDGKLMRVHLRAYAAAGRRVEALAEAFVATIQQPPSGHDKLVRFCACLGDFADSGEIAFDAVPVRAYFNKVAGDGYPAVHHSAAYRSAYRPAYRIVNIDYLSL